MSQMATLSTDAFASLSFDQKLDRLAEVAVRIGLNLREGQELFLTAPTDALPLVRRITEQAYKAGAKLVTPILSDDAITLARYQYAPDDSFDYAPSWYFDGLSAAFKSGAARLAITGTNPALLAAEDPTRVSRASKANSKAYKPALEFITRHEINWTIVAAATPEWAALVFPQRPFRARHRQALGCHLRRLPHHLRRSRRRLAAARQRPQAAR